MIWWIWALIIAFVLVVAFLSLRNKKPDIVRIGGSDNFWDKVKNACCGKT